MSSATIPLKTLPPLHCPSFAGTPVQFTSTLDTLAGLVKGVSALVTSCDKHSVRVQLRNGTIWRIPRTSHKYRPSHLKDTVQVTRHQLPLAVSFASTVHRVQGDTLHAVVLDLRDAIFAHGQLYTAITRILERHGLHVLVPPEDFRTLPHGESSFRCKNIVIKSILRYVQ